MASLSTICVIHLHRASPVLTSFSSISFYMFLDKMSIFLEKLPFIINNLYFLLSSRGCFAFLFCLFLIEYNFSWKTFWSLPLLYPKFSNILTFCPTTPLMFFSSLNIKQRIYCVNNRSLFKFSRWTFGWLQEVLL